MLLLWGTAFLSGQREKLFYLSVSLQYFTSSKTLHHPISHSLSLCSQSLLGSAGICIPSAHKKFSASQSFVLQGFAWWVLIPMI